MKFGQMPVLEVDGVALGEHADLAQGDGGADGPVGLGDRGLDFGLHGVLAASHEGGHGEGDEGLDDVEFVVAHLCSPCSITYVGEPGKNLDGKLEVKLQRVREVTRWGRLGRERREGRDSALHHRP